jgi:hypothetical protein
MICYSRCHGWCSLKPFVSADQSFNSQALVPTAEVVNRPYQIHPRFKRMAEAGYCSPSSHKARQALSKCRIEPLYEGRVDYSSSLRCFYHSFDFGFRAFYDSAVNADNASRLVLLYRLRDEDSLPHYEARTACLTISDWLTKDLSNRTDVSLQPVCAEQDTDTQGRSAHSYLLNKAGYKSCVAAFANNSPQPQPRAYHHSHCHPQNSALLTDTKLIHLYLPQITRRGDKLLVKRVAMLTCSQLPTCNRALVKREGSNNGLNWTAEGKQSDHLSNELLRVSKTVKGSARGLSKSLVTHHAFIATLLAGMHADVAFKKFASGRTVHIRTKYLRRVQVGNPFRYCEEIQKGLSLDPRFIQNHLLHGLLWSYRVRQCRYLRSSAA